jgi:hypothetical protein
MKEIVVRCGQTHALKYGAINEHRKAIDQFTQDAKECPRRAETGGCDDNRNAHHYCRWWACPLTKED